MVDVGVTVAAVKTAIQTVLEGVTSPAPGVKNVQLYRRNIKRLEDFVKAFTVPTTKGDKTINVWIMEPPASTIDPGIQHGHFVKISTYPITGYMSFVDRKESEILVTNMLEAIENAFLTDISLGGVVVAITAVRTAQDSPVFFGKHLTHLATVELDIETHLQFV